MILAKYDNYKDSGVEWLGKIPSQWEAKRVKDVITKIGSGVTPKGGSEIYPVNGIPFLRSQNVYDEGLVLDCVAFITEEINEKMKSSQIKPNDILLNITGASIGRTCIVPDSLKKANINQHIAFLRLKNEANIYFFSIYLKSNFIKEYISSQQNGASKEAFNLGQIAVIPILDFENNRSRLIFKFLDKKTSQIDRKIKLLQEKKETYEELKKSIINETVCRGLNKDVELKYSGIEWIGKIPKHWKVERLRGFCKVSTSSVNKKINENEKLVKLVNYTNVYGNLAKEIYNNSNYMVVSANNQQRNEKKLIMGDVLFTPSSETIEDIGVSSVVMENLNNTLYSYHLVRARFFKNINNGFKKYLFNNDIVQYYFSKSAKGTTRQILNLNVFNNLIIVLPPKEEQIQIANYLDKKTFKIDKIISKINAQIETLKEFRKTLINDVVTGKVRIQDE